MTVAVLEVIRGDVTERIRFLRPRSYTIGRARTSDIAFNEPSISKSHCRWIPGRSCLLRSQPAVALRNGGLVERDVTGASAADGCRSAARRKRILSVTSPRITSRTATVMLSPQEAQRTASRVFSPRHLGQVMEKSSCPIGRAGVNERGIGLARPLRPRSTRTPDPLASRPPWQAPTRQGGWWSAMSRLPRGGSRACRGFSRDPRPRARSTRSCCTTETPTCLANRLWCPRTGGPSDVRKRPAGRLASRATAARPSSKVREIWYETATCVVLPIFSRCEPELVARS